MPSPGNIPRPFILCGKDQTSDTTISVVNPYNDQSIYDICTANPRHLDLAVSGAVEARKILKSMPLFRRAEILQETARYLLHHESEVTESIVREAGKPVRFAKAEFDRCLDNLHLCSEQGKYLTGELINMDASSAGQNRKGYWLREPVGIVLAISPFNFPLNLVAHKVAPAVMAGCPVIIKPASKTPGSALWLTRALIEAGLPAKAISCLIGSGTDVALPLVKRPEISKVTFTGSYQTGILIASQAGLKKATFELGSNSAAIVDHELIDFDYAVKRLCLGSFYYQGQVCISVQRIYIHQLIYERFLNSFIEMAKKLKLGDPADDETDIGPMISIADAERVKSWIDHSLSNGARLHCGGTQDGSFIQPTILSSIHPDDPLSAQEVFGPVVIIEPVKSIDEGIMRANNSRFGLQAGIFTRHIDSIEKAISELDVGGVIVNDFPSFRLDHMPYGGVKDSGKGREGSRFAIEEMTRIKMVVINNEIK